MFLWGLKRANGFVKLDLLSNDVPITVVTIRSKIGFGRPRAIAERRHRP